MNLNEVKSFIKLAKEEGVSELSYEAKDLKISVSFVSSHAPVSIQPVAIQQKAIQETNEILKNVSTGIKYHEIKSPFVGTFYGSPSPDEANYVKVGDKVKKGQVLCILEAMKIMNEIECDASGEVVEICIENESLVEFGQVLFKIKT